MKMNTPADKKYIQLVFYVLNRIKESLLLDPDKKQIVDYRFDLNIMRREPRFMEERAILQKLRNDGIISDIGEVDIIEGGEKGTPSYQVDEVYHFKVSEDFNDYYDRYQRKRNVTENYCWFDNNTFILTLQDNSIKAISFDTQRGKRSGLSLFQALIDHWKKYGDKPITRSEIIKSTAKYGSKIEAIQLKNIIANIRNKKIKPAGLEKIIKIKYSKKNNGWVVDIKR